MEQSERGRKGERQRERAHKGIIEQIDKFEEVVNLSRALLELLALFL